MWKLWRCLNVNGIFYYMTEQPVFFSSSSGRLEGLLGVVPGDGGVVITHPHPLYGGDMHNTVVTALTRAYQRAGYTTLRFNFRGVGRSQGDYDEGRGEQQDVRAALDFLAASGKTALTLAGYSFGAWVNALTAPPADAVKQIIMVSPPVALLDFAPVASVPQLRLVVTGERDPFAPPDLLESLLPQWNPLARLEVVPGADHFYSGGLDRLAVVLAAYLAPLKAGQV